MRVSTVWQAIRWSRSRTIIGFSFRVVEALRVGLLRDVDLVQNKRKSIYLARQQRALATTAEYVEKNMPDLASVISRPEILSKAFARADVSGDRLICEFGVFKGASINRLAKLTTKTVFGFDAFEGLPEEYGDVWKKGEFLVSKLPKVGFLHIDSDLYSSCKTIFDLLGPRLGPGTVILFDEYFNFPHWEEAEIKAFQEYLSKTGYSFEFISYNRNGEQVAVFLK